MTSLRQQTLALLKTKNIVVLGTGVTGMSMIRFLHANDIDFVVNDSRKMPINAANFAKKFPKIELRLNGWDLARIAKADILLVSPGIDLDKTDIKKVTKLDCLIWGDIELFSRLSDMPLLAVTGSNGKSTVVSLLVHLGKKLNYRVALGGNVGQPVLDHLITEDSPVDFLVLELSSFQLETLTSMQAIATTVLNVSDDHLDRHLSIENYQAIKQSIYRQGKIAVYNRDDVATVNDDVLANPKTISFGGDEPQSGHFGISVIDGQARLNFGEKALTNLNTLTLAGRHNALNYLAALALGHCAGWSLPLMVDNLASFTGLEHRCQRVKSYDNISWINDSKATNVGATLAAINGLAQSMTNGQKLVLIAGGDGKGADFSPLKPAIQQHVDQLITLGKDGDQIAALVENSIKVATMEQAVLTANRFASNHDTVLLSPACASLDMFKNFAERGYTFAKAVLQLEEAS